MTMHMTDDHKAALAVGRERGRAVKRYLEALEATKRKRGRPRTTASVTAQLDQVDKGLTTATGVRRLELAQRKIDLEAALAALAVKTVDIAPLEAEFVAVGAFYAESKGISRKAFLACGVPAKVLDEAGIRQ